MKKYVLAFIVGIAYLNSIFAGEWKIETYEDGNNYADYSYAKEQPITGSLLKTDSLCIVQVHESSIPSRLVNDFTISFSCNSLLPKYKYDLETELKKNGTGDISVRIDFQKATITKCFTGLLDILTDNVRISINNENGESVQLFKILKEYRNLKISIYGYGWNLQTTIDKIPIISDKNYPYWISNDKKCFNGIRNWEKADITSVVIPEGITEIGLFAFSDCTNLETITIPKTIKNSIFGFGFSKCPKLKTAILSDSSEEICSYLFSDCRSLETIEIPKSVKIINDSAFTNCESLKSINIRSVETITKGAFDGCKSLKNLESDSKFWHIEDVFFMGGDSIYSVLDLKLEKYTLPKNIQKEDFELFIHSCYSTIKELVISSPTKIENIDFSDEICSNRLKNLKKISVPKSVKLSHFPTTVQIIRK